MSVGTYTLIHAFLRGNSHTKAADAVKKAAKDIPGFRESIADSEQTIDSIVKQWRERKPEETPKCVKNHLWRYHIAQTYIETRMNQARTQTVRGPPIPLAVH